MGWVPREILERPVALRSGTGNAHEAVSTSSTEAQALYDQGLNYLHGYLSPDVVVATRVAPEWASYTGRPTQCCLADWRSAGGGRD